MVALDHNHSPALLEHRGQRQPRCLRNAWARLRSSKLCLKHIHDAHRKRISSACQADQRIGCLDGQRRSARRADPFLPLPRCNQRPEQSISATRVPRPNAVSRRAQKSKAYRVFQCCFIAPILPAGRKGAGPKFWCERRAQEYL